MAAGILEVVPVFWSNAQKPTAATVQTAMIAPPATTSFVVMRRERCGFFPCAYTTRRRARRVRLPQRRSGSLAPEPEACGAFGIVLPRIAARGVAAVRIDDRV